MAQKGLTGMKLIADEQKKKKNNKIENCKEIPEWK
jgi:hypothetical protein